jgi:hypothetical protein
MRTMSLLTSPDVADDVELADSLSIAMLTVLETLGPTERAVFVLREVFEVPHTARSPRLNGSPAGRVEFDGQVAAISLAVEHGRITRIYAIANPRKLARLDQPADLARQARLVGLSAHARDHALHQLHQQRVVGAARCSCEQRHVLTPTRDL